MRFIRTLGSLLYQEVRASKALFDEGHGLPQSFNTLESELQHHIANDLRNDVPRVGTLHRPLPSHSCAAVGSYQDQSLEGARGIHVWNSLLYREGVRPAAPSRTNKTQANHPSLSSLQILWKNVAVSPVDEVSEDCKARARAKSLAEGSDFLAGDIAGRATTGPGHGFIGDVDVRTQRESRARCFSRRYSEGVELPGRESTLFNFDQSTSAASATQVHRQFADTWSPISVGSDISPTPITVRDGQETVHGEFTSSTSPGSGAGDQSLEAWDGGGGGTGAGHHNHHHRDPKLLPVYRDYRDRVARMLLDGQTARAEALVQQMNGRAVPPDETFFTNVLQTVVREDPELVHADKVLWLMGRYCAERPGVWVINHALQDYLFAFKDTVRADRWLVRLELFHGIVRNKTTVKLLVFGYLCQARGDEAWAVLANFWERCGDVVTQNTVRRLELINEILRFACRHNRPKAVSTLLSLMHRQDLPGDRDTLYLVTHGVIYHGVSVCAAAVMTLFQRLRDGGVELDLSIYTYLFGSHVLNGRFAMAAHVFVCMRSDLAHTCTPGFEPAFFAQVFDVVATRLTSRDSLRYLVAFMASFAVPPTQKMISTIAERKNLPPEVRQEWLDLLRQYAQPEFPLQAAAQAFLADLSFHLPSHRGLMPVPIGSNTSPTTPKWTA